MRKRILTIAVIAATTLMFAACGQTTPEDYGVETEMNGRFETIVDKEDETPTATVAPTEAPEITETPEPTVDPEILTPAVTETPVPTEEPVVVEPTVAPTEAPVEDDNTGLGNSVKPDVNLDIEIITPEPTEEPVPTATPKPTATPAPTATPVPTKTPEPTKAPVAESKDFETVLNELFVLFTYDERADYIAKLDKSAYKVGTIDGKKFFGTDLNRWFTDEMIDFGGERYDGGYRTGKNVKYITLEDLSTGEVHVWGVEFEVEVDDSIKTDVLIMENVVLEYNYNYAAESGAVLDWPTLKYYIDVFNPADYLE